MKIMMKMKVLNQKIQKNLDDVLDEQQDELEDVPNIDDVLDEQKDELEDILV